MTYVHNVENIWDLGLDCGLWTVGTAELRYSRLHFKFRAFPHVTYLHQLIHLWSSRAAQSIGDAHLGVAVIVALDSSRNPRRLVISTAVMSLKLKRILFRSFLRWNRRPAVVQSFFEIDPSDLGADEFFFDSSLGSHSLSFKCCLSVQKPLFETV